MLFESDLAQRLAGERIKDRLREAEHHRLVKAVARPGPNHLQKVAAALRKAVVELTARPISRQPEASVSELKASSG